MLLTLFKKFHLHNFIYKNYKFYYFFINNFFQNFILKANFVYYVIIFYFNFVLRKISRQKPLIEHEKTLLC